MTASSLWARSLSDLSWVSRQAEQVGLSELHTQTLEIKGALPGYLPHLSSRLRVEEKAYEEG